MGKTRAQIISLVGARPQFIKLAALSRALARPFRHIVVHSGQHYDYLMSEVFFRQLNIPRPDYNLEVGSGDHGEMTGAILERFEKLLRKHPPDLVLVYGDTNSTLAGALAAAKLQIPVAHVEAGLRSYNPAMPEEINRRVADHLSALLFCPTPQAVRNLKKEGLARGVIHCGDVMYELLDHARARIARNQAPLRHLGLIPKQYLLMTMHRAGNVDDRGNLEKIAEIMLALPLPVVFPVHPRTAKNLRRFRLWSKLSQAAHLRLIEPLAYLDNLTLVRSARAVLTDSGGLQKEAIFLSTPCLTLREETEWVETLKWGNRLVGLSCAKTLRSLPTAVRALPPIEFRIAEKAPSEIIVAALLSHFHSGDV